MAEIIPRKPNPRSLDFGFLGLSALLSLAILATRNLYDDELSSFEFITLPFAQIIRTQAHRDVHPPGMYLLAHLALCILPSFRWMNLFALLAFYAGLSAFVITIAPIFTTTQTRICFLLLATLHPQLLMWCTSFRWYSWWTGLALAVLIIALQPRVARPQLSPARALGIGFAMGCLFYLNYITFLFAAALAVAMYFRYRTLTRRQWLPFAGLSLLVFAALIAPQLHIMFAEHLPNSEGQRGSIAVSLVRLLVALTASEAFMPWHPLAVLAVATFAALAAAAAAIRFHLIPQISASNKSVAYPAHTNKISAGSEILGPQSLPGLHSILTFASAFLLLVVFSGLGGKPRNGLLLVPLLALPTAIALDLLPARLQQAALLLFVLWSVVGTTHLLGRYGIAKATMNDRPEQVVDLIQRTTGNACPVVVTYDAWLSFTLSQSRLPGLILVSGAGEPIFMQRPSQPAAPCTLIRLFVVKSYRPPGPQTNTLDAELKSATGFVQGQPNSDLLSPDREAPMKRRLASISITKSAFADAAELPDDRYEVTSGPISPSALPTLLKDLPDFDSSSNPSLVRTWP